MTIEQIAAKFHEYMEQGAFEKIYQELYSENATSEEPPGSDWTKANGMKEILEKGKKWQDFTEEMYGGSTGKPVVAGNYFTSFMTMDFKPKGGERTKMEEIGLYKIENGKIVSEQFFY